MCVYGRQGIECGRGFPNSDPPSPGAFFFKNHVCTLACSLHMHVQYSLLLVQ